MSFLPTVSKVIEIIMHKQISIFGEKFLCSYMCGYRKGFSKQQALLSFTETWKKVLDRKGYGGAVLMDLSKAFDAIIYILLARLHAYGFTNK